MRIGELAATVGVTPRAVRHYHHLGLLPEPERRANGYRDYTLRHAVVLARIRRLTELGLGLAEVRDVLADDAGRELVEVLGELEEDLARQETEIRERRERLRDLIEGARAGRLSAEGPVSPELASLFGRFGPVPESPMAAKDREVFALLETTATPEARAAMLAALESMMAAPGAVERVREAYALLDALADAEPDDPRVAEAARVLAALVPPDMVPPDTDLDIDGSDGRGGGGGGAGGGGSSFLRAFYADFSPAQAEAIRRTLRTLREDRP
ncbi:MerR family transcriptional regulator [Streptomyces scabiei]|uniref:MerR family transcriptional regulator n=1 Tax=Streptomyces scabiei TaxID=1930 RepID=UPI000765D221|nr:MULTISPECIES: MerR family transcriptional regulator [Streptomyces]MBP5894048.1 MerR family transcriptional regulator [Streptomyces sp. LBUM 1481]MBP5924305.1 MerR family transcriptional regulator [Streptomyces sp. LBUM 1483]MDX2687181.1 MerR family transcriptional regulator [Streptomyces scabiei]MDX2751712.1 MerR family transcriptional regulator [Streptomyces scabiei]MDX2810511.1 MerR family transcriptional regulator [Streptomyces scabiei]